MKKEQNNNNSERNMFDKANQNSKSIPIDQNIAQNSVNNANNDNKRNNENKRNNNNKNNNQNPNNQSKK